MHKKKSCLRKSRSDTLCNNKNRQNSSNSSFWYQNNFDRINILAGKRFIIICVQVWAAEQLPGDEKALYFCWYFRNRAT